MMWNSVDLPQPDGPMTETNSPGATSKDTSSTAVTAPLAGVVALGDALHGERRLRRRGRCRARQQPAGAHPLDRVRAEAMAGV